METIQPVLVTREYNQKQLILIVDKKGTLGSELANKLQEEFMIVLLTRNEIEIKKNTVHIPYLDTFPAIPNNHYEYMFIFYSGEKQLLSLLPSMLRKAVAERAKLFFIAEIGSFDARQIKRLLEHPYQRFHLLLYGELFDQKAHFNNWLSHALTQARTYGSVTVANEGLGTMYPIALNDVVAGIIHTAFVYERKDPLQLLFPRNGFTQLSVARMLQKINPLLRINFHKRAKKSESIFVPKRGIGLFANYPLEERLRYIVKEHPRTIPLAPIDYGKMPRHQSVSVSHKGILSFGSILLVLFGGLVVMPLLALALLVSIGFFALFVSSQQLQKGEISQLNATGFIAESSLGASQSLIDSFFPLNLVPQKQFFVEKLAVAQKLSGMVMSIGTIAQTGERADLGKVTGEQIQESIVEAKSALLSMQELETTSLPESVSKKLGQFKEQRILAENLIEATPKLLGFPGKQRYLLLFQNNKELRPGGGFIGSYGLITVEKGKTGELHVYDVYDADGKLKQSVTPPFALERYVGMQHWFMRDSNFDVDFASDGQLASAFLYKETGERVDGVIAIDTDFLKNMLGVLGKVSVPEYNETVTPDNFYLLTQSHAENNFFPGSTQKKNFLQALVGAMLVQFSQKNTSARLVSQALVRSVQEKHVLVAFPSNPSLQSLVTVNGLSGSLWDNRSSGNNTFLDTFGVVDGNIGLNKANNYLSRSISQGVMLQENGDIEEIAAVTYTNSATKTSPFGGDYKNYVRFVLPDHAILKGVALDGVEQKIVPAVTNPSVFSAKFFTPPQGLEIETTEEQGKELVGFFVTVGMGTSKKVRLTYAVANALSSQDTTTYSLRVIKQPGTDADPYTLFLGFPQALRIVRTSSGMETTENGLQFSGRLMGDLLLEASVSKE